MRRKKSQSPAEFVHWLDAALFPGSPGFLRGGTLGTRLGRMPLGDWWRPCTRIKDECSCCHELGTNILFLKKACINQFQQCSTPDHRWHMESSSKYQTSIQDKRQLVGNTEKLLSLSVISI